MFRHATLPFRGNAEHGCAFKEPSPNSRFSKNEEQRHAVEIVYFIGALSWSTRQRSMSTAAFYFLER
jgi:hypothetical protein